MQIMVLEKGWILRNFLMNPTEEMGEKSEISVQIIGPFYSNKSKIPVTIFTAIGMD
jgi:hypothetical protein